MIEGKTEPSAKVVVYTQERDCDSVADGQERRIDSIILTCR